MLKEGKTRINFVVTKELKSKLQKMADAEHRSLGNLISARLTEMVERDEFIGRTSEVHLRESARKGS